MRVETQKLRELILSTGTTKTCATRRANETEREGGYMLRALIWGIKTFGPSAPTRVVFIDKNDPCKSIAAYARKHGYKQKF